MSTSARLFGAFWHTAGRVLSAVWQPLFLHVFPLANLLFLARGAVLFVTAENKAPGEGAALHARIAVLPRHLAALAMLLVRTTPTAAHAFSLIPQSYIAIALSCRPHCQSHADHAAKKVPDSSDAPVSPGGRHVACELRERLMPCST